jgi:hypothetical protein
MDRIIVADGRAGYAAPLPRCGADATTYAMTGSSGLIFR